MVIYKFKDDSSMCIASTLLLGDKYSKLSTMIENQGRISASVLQRILDDLLEADRQIALRVVNQNRYSTSVKFMEKCEPKTDVKS